MSVRILKLLALIIFTPLITFLLAKSVYAQTGTIDQPSQQNLNYQNPSPLQRNISPQSPQFINLQLLNLAHSISCIAAGIPLSPEPCLDLVPKNINGAVSYIPVLSSVNFSGGILGSATSVLTTLYTNKPLSTSEYLASMGEQIGIITPAKAQAPPSVPGSGSTILSPILQLWQISRNFAYLAMVIVFMTVGLMVMFRRKLNPQTVLSIQAALPGLVIGLVMITFSYFLASLITDLAFIGTDIVGFYFAQAPGATISTPTNPTSLSQNLSNQNAVSIGSSFIGKIGHTDLEHIAYQFYNSLDPTLGGPRTWVQIFVGLAAYQFGAAIGPYAGYILGGAIGLFAGALNPVGAVVGGQLGRVVGETIGGPVFGSLIGIWAATNVPSALGWAMYLIALFIMLYSVIKLMFNLINNFLQIIFLTITSPFHFLAGSLPGRQGIIVNWARNMLCNVLVFPAVIAVFYFAAYMLGNNSVATFGVSGAANIFPTNFSTLPLFGGINIDSLRLLLVFGAIVASPAIPEVICKSIGKPGAAGDLIGRSINEGMREGRNYNNQLNQNTAKTAGNMKEAWTKWRGQDPYYSAAHKYRQIYRDAVGNNQAEPLPEPLRPTEPRVNCLPPNTLIATAALGWVEVKKLGIGDWVWSVDSFNRKVKVVIKNINKAKVPLDHKVVQIILEDSRVLTVSIGHPDMYGKDLALLNIGDKYNSSVVVSKKILEYKEEYTYDILPDSESGFYWANGILIGSTLASKNEVGQNLNFKQS